MKTVIALSICFLLQLNGIKAQTREDLFTDKEIKYFFYGIDYSNAKFIGEFAHFEESGQKNMEGIKSEFFSRWNDVLIKESDKFDVKKAFRLNNLAYRIEEITTVNEATEVDSMAATKSTAFSKADIEAIVSNYNFEAKEGVGIIFISEYLNKNSAKGCFHFVVFSHSTKEVLLQDRFVESARGFGLRNYWINPVYKAIGGVEYKYKTWKSSVSN